MEKENRIRITYPLLMALGFKKHECIGVKACNYIKNDFKINDALGRFCFNEEMLEKIEYLDELLGIYKEKTGLNLNLTHKDDEFKFENQSLVKLNQYPFPEEYYFVHSQIIKTMKDANGKIFTDKLYEISILGDGLKDFRIAKETDLINIQ